MASRYAGTPRIAGGRQQATPRGALALARAVRNGQVKVRTRVLKELERLDVIAGEVYGDARMYWVIAAASGIGWGMQAPPGTVLKIPTDLAQVKSITG
jgi:nucleoid-associated protein YgaU